MAKSISKSTLDFLKQLKKNNNRDWFNDHRGQYETARGDFLEFVAALIQKIAKFDSSVAHVDPNKAIFRLFRDVRFSKDKSPYKTNFGAHIHRGGKGSVHDFAGYYLHLEPGASMLAGGAYMPPTDWLLGIRQAIAANPKRFEAVINTAPFKRYFKEIEGEKLARPPKGFAVDHPAMKWLKHKSFLVTHALTDKQVLAPKFLDYSGEVYKALLPFDQFLNNAR